MTKPEWQRAAEAAPAQAPAPPAETPAPAPEPAKNPDVDQPGPAAGAATPGKYAPRGRGKPFAKGNPGKKKGTRNKTTMALEVLLEGEADKLTRKAIKMALAGDAAIMRLCLDRLMPARKGRVVRFALPAIVTVADVATAMGSITAAMAAGQLSPAEAVEVAGVVELQRRAIETQEIEARLRSMEERFK